MLGRRLLLQHFNFSEVPVIKGYRDFIVRGNVIDLAVGVIMGAAFKTVVDNLVSGLLEPFIAVLFGKPDVSHVGQFSIHHVQFGLGLILTAVINFLLVAAAVYFFIVTPINKLRPAQTETEPSASDNELLTQIRDLLRNQQP
jgi:large conductance mechanosensitive channel